MEEEKKTSPGIANFSLLCLFKKLSKYLMKQISVNMKYPAIVKLIFVKKAQ